MNEENWCDATGEKNGEAIRSATEEAKRVEVWRVRPTEGGAWLIDPKLSNLVELLESETSEGHSFTLEKTSMTADEVANMGEFDGW